MANSKLFLLLSLLLASVLLISSKVSAHRTQSIEEAKGHGHGCGHGGYGHGGYGGHYPPKGEEQVANPEGYGLEYGHGGYGHHRPPKTERKVVELDGYHQHGLHGHGHHYPPNVQEQPYEGPDRSGRGHRSPGGHDSRFPPKKNDLN